MLRSSSSDDDRARDEREAASRAREDRDVTYLAPGFRVEGELQSPGDLRVAGRVDGVIRARGEVEVVEQGEVDAEVHATSVVVAGTLRGTVRASERATFRKGCQVEGDVHAPVISLEEGGKLTGRLHMSGDAESPRTSSSSTGGESGKAGGSGSAKAGGDAGTAAKAGGDDGAQTALALDVTFVGECVDAALDEAEDSDIEVEDVLDALRRLQHAVPDGANENPKARKALKERLVRAIRTAHEEGIPVDEAVEKALR